MIGKPKKGAVEEGGWITIEMIIAIAVMVVILLIIGVFGKPIVTWIGKTISGLFGG